MGFTTAALIAGTGLQAFGQYRAAQDQAAAEEYNAKIARQEAEIAKQRGKLQADRQRKLSRRFLAQNRVNIAKSGVAFSGSSLEVWKDNAEELELDALIIEYNSRIDQTRSLSEASIREDRADRVRRQGIMNAATTVLKQSAGFLANQGTQASGRSGTVAGTGKTQSQILGFDTRRFS